MNICCLYYSLYNQGRRVQCLNVVGVSRTDFQQLCSCSCRGRQEQKHQACTTESTGQSFLSRDVMTIAVFSYMQHALISRTIMQILAEQKTLQSPQNHQRSQNHLPHCHSWLRLRLHVDSPFAHPGQSCQLQVYAWLTKPLLSQ